MRSDEHCLSSSIYAAYLARSIVGGTSITGSRTSYGRPALTLVYHIEYTPWVVLCLCRLTDETLDGSLPFSLYVLLDEKLLIFGLHVFTHSNIDAKSNMATVFLSVGNIRTSAIWPPHHLGAISEVAEHDRCRRPMHTSRHCKMSYRNTMQHACRQSKTKKKRS